MDDFQGFPGQRRRIVWVKRGVIEVVVPILLSCSTLIRIGYVLSAVHWCWFGEGDLWISVVNR